MFVTKKKFRQKINTEHYPETTTYKHLGTNINKRGELNNHLKPVTNCMIRTALALIRIKNDGVPPKRLSQLFFILSKAVLDYPGPILHLQKDRLKSKFSRLSYKTARLILGLRRSSPIRILHQLCGDPKEEWKRRNMYYMLGSENRTTNVEYTKLVQDKTERTELRNRMTWQTLRVACLPLKAKGICN